MKYFLALGACAFLSVPTFAEEKIKSGPEVGTTGVLPFAPLHCSGERTGEKACLVCEHGQKPVVMIFARSWSKPLTSLVRKIEAVNRKKGEEMGSFVVVLDDSREMKKRLTALAKKEKLQKVTLAVDDVAGPRGYKIPVDADVTVITYVASVIKGNYVYAEGKMTEKDVKTIVADLPKILSLKKQK